MSNQTPELPINLNLIGGGGTLEVASATFYRTQFNNNIEITIPVGSASGGVTVNTTLVTIPVNSFNSTSNSANITASTQNFTIGTSMDIIHNVKILAKMQQVGGVNYSNYRELRCYPSLPDGTPYNSAVGTNIQPATGDMVNVLIDGKIAHNSGDVVTLAFQVAQVTGSSSDTLLTIFRIDWLLTGAS